MMTTKKTAISVEAALLAEVDEAARERGESRSQFITRLLRLAVRSRRDAAITHALDEIFADASLAEEQERAADELDRSGTTFEDERW
jgi:metal-responsive CopG/Arc/MetJ family transcriptional regulator